LLWNQLRARPKQNLDMFIGQVAMPGRNADDQIWFVGIAFAAVGRAGRRVATAREHDLANDALDDRAIELCCCAHARGAGVSPAILSSDFSSGRPEACPTISFTSAAARRSRHAASIS